LFLTASNTLFGDKSNVLLGVPLPFVKVNSANSFEADVNAAPLISVAICADDDKTPSAFILVKTLPSV